MARKPKEEQQGTAAKLYKHLEADREPFLRRARECALYTIPSLIPPEGHTGSDDFYTPYQSVGARGMNHLGNKILLSMLPPNVPFFRFAIDDATLRKLSESPSAKTEVDAKLNEMERQIQAEIEGGAYRISAFEGVKHLLAAGNFLTYLPPEGGMRIFQLWRYVVQRDQMGHVLDMVVKEDVSPAMLDDDILIAVGLKEDDKDKPKEPAKTDREKNVTMYTHVTWTGKRWDVYQEINGKVVPGSEGHYPQGKCPWFPVRFTKVDGENYGRSYVEEYLGDLQSLEGLSQAILEGSAAAAKVVFMVNPNGTTSQRTVASAENGAVVDGLATDVSVLRLDKAADFRVALDSIRDIQERLSYAFLLNSVVQRPGERVTAEEIRYLANELDAAMGGTNAILSQEFQLPLVSCILAAMQRAKKLPTLPKGIVKPTIVTGLEALGRGNDLNRLQQFFQLAALCEKLPPELDKADALKRAGTAIGIDMQGLVKDPQQVAQDQQRALMMSMVQQGMNPAITQAGGLMKQAMTNNQQGAANGATAQAAEPQ